MPMITTNEVKNGVVVVVDGDLLQVTEFQHVLQNKVAYIRVKLKNLRTGATRITTFNAGVKIESVDIDRKTMQYLYMDADFAYFMDKDTYDQIEIPLERLEWEKQFFVDGLDAVITFNGEEVLNVILPDKIPMTVTEATEAVSGNTATNASKTVTVESGFKVQVPQFIKAGEKILVSSIDGKYCSRA